MRAVDGAAFETEVLGADVPVLVDFWAADCAPCRAQEPHLDTLERRHRPGLRVVRVDVDAEPGLASRHGVLSLPTLVLMVGGREVGRIAGGARPRALERLVAPHLAA